MAGCLNECLQIAAESNSKMLQVMEGKLYVPSDADENSFASLPAKYT